MTGVQTCALPISERYRIPALSLQQDALQLLAEYRWPGNIRQLKNITEQMSILEKNREVGVDILLNYLPPAPLNNLPVRLKDEIGNNKEFNERDLLYKVIFEMKKEMNDLKQIVNHLMQHNNVENSWKENPLPLMHDIDENTNLTNNILPTETKFTIQPSQTPSAISVSQVQKHIEADESLSLTEVEKEFIQKALQKYKGRRKLAAKELGISERTLYRKMNEYGIH